MPRDRNAPPLGAFLSRDGLCGLLAGVAAALIAGTVYWRWLGDTIPAPPLRGPAAEGSLAEALAARSNHAVDLEGTWVAGTGTPGPDWGTWSGFRGNDRANHAVSEPPLAETWPEAGPPVVWSVPMGEGHAGPAVWNGRAFLLDYDEAVGGDALRCLSLDTGREVWRRWYRKPTKRNHGISRTVPAVADGAVVSLGPQCQVLCVAAEDGAFLWGRDLPTQDGTTVPLWYAGQCPLVDGTVVVLAPCGPEVSLAGFDLHSGERLWTAPNPGGWTMSHGSVAVMEVEGTRMYVYAALGGVLGVCADGPGRGTLLWRTEAWKPSVQAPTPLPLGNGRVLLCAGYGVGATLLRIERDPSAATGWRAFEERRLERREFGSEQQTPILAEDVVYGIMPPDGGAARRELVAFRAPDATRLWTSGPDDRFGLGPYLLVNGNRMLVLSDDGVLTLASVGPAGYRRLARAKLLQGRDAWGPMALVGGRLLLRDDRTLLCVDLRKSP